MTASHLIVGGAVFWLLTCWAIIDIARKDFGGIEFKAAWAFAALIPFIGPILYIAIGRRKGTPKSKLPPSKEAPEKQ
jgi:NhaP-type Na+/H+ or K+/H+ antiporter